jgi:hypothetical protein
MNIPISHGLRVAWTIVFHIATFILYAALVLLIFAVAAQANGDDVPFSTARSKGSKGGKAMLLLIGKSRL